MRGFLVSLLVTVALRSPLVHGSGDVKPETPVAVLTDENFEEALGLMNGDEKVWLVEFYAPWCGHCKKLAPVYEEAAATVTQFRFSKVDATANKQSSEKYKIKGYPSIKWVRDGVFHEYHGEHTVEGFKLLAERLYSEPIKELKGVDDFEEFDKDHAVWFLHAHTDTSESTTAGKETFKEVARNFQDSLHFAETSSPSVIAKAAGKDDAESSSDGQPFIAKVHGHGNEQLVKFGLNHEALGAIEKEQRAEKLLAWVSDQKLPLVSSVKLSGLKYVARNGRLFCVSVVSSDDDMKKYREGLLRIARPKTDLLDENIQSQYYYGIIDSREENVDKFLLHYGVDVKKLPTVLVFNFTDRRNEQYYNDGTQALDAVPELLQGVINGTVAPRSDDFWDFPEKLWLNAKATLSFLPLEKLDFLPRYTFTACLGLLILAVCMAM